MFSYFVFYASHLHFSTYISCKNVTKLKHEVFLVLIKRKQLLN